MPQLKCVEYVVIIIGRMPTSTLFYYSVFHGGASFADIENKRRPAIHRKKRYRHYSAYYTHITS